LHFEFGYHLTHISKIITLSSLVVLLEVEDPVTYICSILKYVLSVLILILFVWR